MATTLGLQDARDAVALGGGALDDALATGTSFDHSDDLILNEGGEFDLPLFAFHELDYIPSGFSGILAPYIETGCGDGEFLIGLLLHLNSPSPSPSASLQKITGFGVDYNSALISTATSNALLSPRSPSSWLVYDFNADLDDLASTLELQGVTHVFVYLVPKQLALPTVRGILERWYMPEVHREGINMYHNAGRSPQNHKEGRSHWLPRAAFLDRTAGSR
ncbi:hypothetical protein RQP46_001600 [Phenoliferia psychrophenolica]